MKVLMVSEDVPRAVMGGLGKHAVNLANALLLAGHEVEFLGADTHPFTPSENLSGLQTPFHATLRLRHTQWKESALGFFNPVRRPFMARRVAAAIMARAHLFDVVHYHGHLSTVGSLIPANVNFVQSRHDQGADCLINIRFKGGQVCRSGDPEDCASCMHRSPGMFRREVSALAVRRFRRATQIAFARHKVIHVSEFLRRNSARFAEKPESFREYMVHNFVDVDRLRTLARDVSRAAVHGTRFAIPARIDRSKGVGQFLECGLRRLKPGMEFVVIGDGPDMSTVASKISVPEVRFLGWCPYTHTVRELAAADVVIVPSVCEEPCATTILEGLALGKMVLALDRGGSPELKQYERWAGQLRLYPSLEAMADDLPEDYVSHDVDWGVPFGADVRSILPQILAVYRD